MGFHQEYPDDMSSKLYVKRIKSIQSGEVTIPNDWDGATNLTEK